MINKMQLASLAIPVYADELPKIEIGSSNMGGFSGMATLTVGGVIGWLIGIVMAIAAIIFFFILITGGIKWLTSGGDEKKVAAARASLTSALVGLAIVFASWAIMKLLGDVLGINFFSFQLPQLIPKV